MPSKRVGAEESSRRKKNVTRVPHHSDHLGEVPGLGRRVYTRISLLIFTQTAPHSPQGCSPLFHCRRHHVPLHVGCTGDMLSVAPAPAPADHPLCSIPSALILQCHRNAAGSTCHSPFEQRLGYFLRINSKSLGAPCVSLCPCLPVHAQSLSSPLSLAQGRSRCNHMDGRCAK